MIHPDHSHHYVDTSHGGFDSRYLPTEIDYTFLNIVRDGSEIRRSSMKDDELDLTVFLRSEERGEGSRADTTSMTDQSDGVHRSSSEVASGE